MRVLVTGAAGFIGRALVDALAAQPQTSAASAQNPSFVLTDRVERPSGSPPGASWCRGEIDDPALHRPVVRRTGRRRLPPRRRRQRRGRGGLRARQAREPRCDDRAARTLPRAGRRRRPGRPRRLRQLDRGVRDAAAGPHRRCDAARTDPELRRPQARLRAADRRLHAARLRRRPRAAAVGRRRAAAARERRAVGLQQRSDPRAARRTRLRLSGVDPTRRSGSSRSATRSPT